MARPELMALLADVKENPDDLTPWLVLTDWLEEYGDESDRARAEYCRLCFDKLCKETYASDWEQGERRRELFRTWKGTWFGGLGRKVDTYPSSQCRVQKGLLQINMEADALLRAIRRRMPLDGGAWVESLVVRNSKPAHIEDLAISGILEGPMTVELHVNQEDQGFSEAIAALAASPYLNQVRKLVIDHRGAAAVPADLLAPLKHRFGKALKSR